MTGVIILNGGTGARFWWEGALAPLSVVSTFLAAWIFRGDYRLGLLLLGNAVPFDLHPAASSPPVSPCLLDLWSPQ